MIRQEATKSDPTEIAKAVEVLFPSGSVVEVRCPSGKRNTGGYFDDHAALVKAAAGITTGNVYVTLNEVDPALLARRANRIDYADTTTADKDIARRRWLLIDLDVQGPSGISRTNEEHETAILKAREVGKALVAMGWPKPILADSGNGGHLLFRIDLPNDADCTKLVQRVLGQLGPQFDDDDGCSPCVKVDQTVFNASRITKLYGTVARKGDPTADRPHRLSKLIFVPDSIEVVTREQLEEFAGPEPPAPEPKRYQGNGHADTFDLRAFIAENLQVRSEGPYTNNNGAVHRWKLETCPLCGESDKSAVVLEFNDGRIGYRCQHNRCLDKGWPAIREHFQPGYRDRRAKRPTAADVIIEAKAPSKPKVVCLRDVVSKEVEWLWNGRFAIGKVSLLVGDPGLGKSFVTLDMTGRVSTGRPWPDARDVSQQIGGVVLLSAEDDLADTIRPRLDAHGADVSRVVALESICFQVGNDDCERTVDLVQDIEAIEAAMEQVENCRLVVIDPISAYMGNVDSHKNADVRGVLAKLQALAERRRVAVVAITHLRKGEGPAMYRSMGSLAYVAAARAAWLVCRDPKDKTRRLVLPVKNNLAPDTDGLAYTISTDGPSGAPVVSWYADAVTMTADEALAPPQRKRGPDPEAAEEAADWLRKKLADGPRLSAELIGEANADGIAERTLRRAHKAIGATATHDGFGGPWSWSLIDGQVPPNGAPSQTTWQSWQPMEELRENGDLPPTEDGQSSIDGQVSEDRGYVEL